ncbi:MAG: hypothetical protein RDV48_13490 [Candidatus Eremiobacteraeota bacterium]|nr:hypothetical protein [Candidatus Eremiobacteraeota bacterium]
MKSGESKKKHKPLQREQEREKKKKWEEFWLPALIITAIIAVMVLLLYISNKSGDKYEKSRERSLCRTQVTTIIGPMIAAYHREKGEYPENLLVLKGYIKSDSDQSKGSTPETPSGIEERVFNIWKNFYCPADKDSDSISYIFEKPGHGTPGASKVLRCRIHGEEVFLTGDDFKRIEASLK